MLKQIGVFSPTGTENPKTPAQFLNQAYSALSENCQFIDEMLQNRLGNEVFIDQELSGAVLFQKQLDFPDNGVLTERRFLVVITTKDIYYLDTGTDTFKYLTPTYTTGTIAVTQGSKTVTGTDTLWAANAKAGDYIRLGALNAATPVWYEIDEVVGNTEITLVTAYAGDTASSQTYTIRKTFTGGRTDYWRYIRIPDKNLGTVYVFANGTDYEIYWDGDTATLAISLSSIPIGKFISILAGRMILFNITEGGITYPDMSKWSAAFDITSFPAVNYKQMPEIKGKIIGLGDLAESVLLFWERGHSLFYYIGGEFTFTNEFLSKDLGTPSPSSIVTTGEGIKWLGEDLKLHLYTGSEHRIIADELSTKFKDITPSLLDYIVSVYFPTLRQVRWLMPFGDVSENSELIMNDEGYQTWHPWIFENDNIFCSFGEYQRVTDLYLDDTVEGEKYLDEEDGYWDDSSLLADAPILLMGGTDGYIYKTDVGLTDDGTAFESVLRFKKFDADLPTHVKRWFKVQPYFKVEAAGSAYVSVREDDNISFSAEQTYDLTDSTGENDILKTMMTFDANGVTIQPHFRIPNAFRMLGFVLHFSQKERVR